MHINKKLIAAFAIFAIGLGVGVAITTITLSHNYAKDKAALMLNNNAESNHQLQSNKYEQSLLRDALTDVIMSNELDKVLTLIKEQKVDVNEPNSEGVYPLEAALVLENVEMAELLLNNGADMNQKTKEGVTIKSYVEAHCGVVMKNLFNNTTEAKMASKSTTKGDTYTVDELYKAIESNNERTVLLILENATVDVNKMTKLGRYPLEAVLLFDNLEMAELLLENGADPEVVTQEGKTIREIVMSGSSKMLKQLFEAY